MKMCALFKLLSCWCVSDKKKEGKGPPVIFVFGTRGSGKATVGQKLAETIGYTYLNAATMVENEVAKASFKGKLIQELRKTRSGLPPELITGILTDHMPETAKGFVIAGYPKNLAEAKQFELEQRKPAIVIFCCIPEDVYVSRCSKKYGDMDETSGKQNYANEHKACEEVFKRYEKKAIKLVTTTPVSENNDRLMAGFKKLGFTDVTKK